MAYFAPPMDPPLDLPRDVGNDAKHQEKLLAGLWRLS
jgi:hypothetical protein